MYVCIAYESPAPNAKIPAHMHTHTVRAYIRKLGLHKDKNLAWLRTIRDTVSVQGGKWRG